VSPCVLLVRLTDAPEDGAGLERVRVQELVEFAVRLDEAHSTEETKAGETSAIEVLADVPFRVAVTTAFWSEGSVFVLIENVAEDAVGETATAEGTDRIETLLANEIEAPDAGAGFERVTAQELLEFAERLEGVHCRDETMAGETRAMEVDCDNPLSVAMTMTVWSESAEIVVRVNVAEEALAEMGTDGGAATLFEVEVRATLAPPVPAGPLRVRLHVEVVDGPRVDGLQDRAVTVNGGSGAVAMLAVPPVGETGRASPTGDAPRTLLIPIGAVVALGVKTSETMPTTPLEIVLEFKPETMQM
jgi:hypothetical protein